MQNAKLIRLPLWGSSCGAGERASVGTAVSSADSGASGSERPPDSHSIPSVSLRYPLHKGGFFAFSGRRGRRPLPVKSRRQPCIFAIRRSDTTNDARCRKRYASIHSVVYYPSKTVYLPFGLIAAQTVGANYESPVKCIKIKTCHTIYPFPKNRGKKMRRGYPRRKVFFSGTNCKDSS